MFTPTWGNDPIWRACFFSKGLVQPPTSLLDCPSFWIHPPEKPNRSMEPEHDGFLQRRWKPSPETRGIYLCPMFAGSFRSFPKHGSLQSPSPVVRFNNFLVTPYEIHLKPFIFHGFTIERGWGWRAVLVLFLCFHASLITIVITPEHFVNHPFYRVFPPKKTPHPPKKKRQSESTAKRVFFQARGWVSFSFRFWYWTFVESYTCHGVGHRCLWLKKKPWEFFRAIHRGQGLRDKIHFPKVRVVKIGRIPKVLFFFETWIFWVNVEVCKSNLCDWADVWNWGGYIYALKWGIWIYKTTTG